MFKNLNLVILFQFFLKCYLETSLGVDFGGQLHKGSMLLPKKSFTFVEDSISKRLTPSNITFCNDKRYLEYQSVAKFNKKNCQSFFYLNRFLQQKNSQNHQYFSDNKIKYRDHVDQYNDDIGVLFNVKKTSLPELSSFPRTEEGSDHVPIRFEEIYGMMLRNLKKNAERTADMTFKNAVFTIWDNSMTIEQRKKYASAILLADLYPSAFVHENTAAAIYHAVNSKYDNPKYDENILIINVGATGTKLSIVRMFTKLDDASKPEGTFHPEIENKLDKFYPEFSGHILDYCFANYSLNKHFNKEKREELIGNLDQTSFHKLIFNAQKPREILSVNKLTRVHIENFFPDMPLSAKVAQNEFEEHCEQEYNELDKILKDFEKLRGDLKYDKIEIIGGVVRTPKIQQIFKDFYKTEIGQHINGEDAPALGASFIAANYTAGVKTKKIGFVDGPNYEVHYTIKVGDNKVVDDQVLFPYKTTYGTKTELSFPNLNQNMDIDLSVKDQNYNLNIKINGTEGLNEKFEGKNITSWNGFVEFELDKMGIPKLGDSYILINETFVEKYNNTKRVLKKQPEEKKEEATEEKQSEQKDSATEEYTIEDSLNKNSTQPLNETATNSTANTTNNTKPKEEYEYIQVEEERLQNKQHKIKLTKERNENINYLFNNKTEFEISKKFLNTFDQFEEDKLQLVMKKNELEGMIFKLKELAEDSHKQAFLKDHEIQLFLNKSQEIDDYVYSDDIENATLLNITSKVDEVKNILAPVNRRMDEHKNRNDIYNYILERFSNHTKEVEGIQKRKSWIPETNFTDLHEYIYNQRENIQRVYKQQQDMPLNEEPIFHVDYLKSIDKEVEKKIKDLRRVPKPKAETNKTDITEGAPKDDFNMDDLKNFDPSKMNLNEEQLKDFKKKLDEMKKKLEDMKENVGDQGEAKPDEEEVKEEENLQEDLPKEDQQPIDEEL